MNIENLKEFNESENWNLFKKEIEKEIELKTLAYDNCSTEPEFRAVREQIRTLRLVLKLPEILIERIESVH